MRIFVQKYTCVFVSLEELIAAFPQRKIATEEERTDAIDEGVSAEIVVRRQLR